jgi:hypothetical protein
VVAQWIALILASVLSAGLLVTATAAASQAWLPEHYMGYDQMRSQIAMNPRGDAILVWQYPGGVPCSRVRPAGQDWQPERCATDLPLGHTGRPQVTVDDQGRATVVWEYLVQSGYLVYAANVSLQDGTWRNPTALSGALAEPPGPSLAMNAAGDVAVAWTAGTSVQIREHAAASGDWTDAESPSSYELQSSESVNPSVAMSARGVRFAVWESFSDRERTRRIIRGFGGAAQSGFIQNISGVGQQASKPAVAALPRGGAVAVWQQQLDATTTMIQAAVRDPVNGVWQPSQNLEAGTDPQLASDVQGNVTIVFASPAGIRTAMLPAGSTTVLAAQDIPGSSAGAVPRLAVNEAGATAVISQTSEGRISGAVRPAGSTTWLTREISLTLQNAREPSVALDAYGDAVASWTEDQPGKPSQTATAGFDGSGPQSVGLQIPSSSHVGVSVGFSVAPLDVWSGVVSTVWSFGDGASAGGTSVSHAFAAGGSYPVTVTSTDTLGNTSSETRVIGVVGPPPPCGDDCDGDLYASSVDCDDTRAALHPGAVDIPGDGVDQDCVDGDAKDLDRDNDGHRWPDDCNDTDPAIHPGAREIPGNKVDEDCVGSAAPFPMLPSTIHTTWNRSPLRLISLTVRDAIRGSRITVRCRGKGCPRRAFVSTVRRTRNVVSVLGELGTARLRRGATVEVRVTKTSYHGKMRRIVVRGDTQDPRRIDRCLDARSQRPFRC